MALRLDEKKALVAEVKEVAARALSAVAAENRGLTAGKFDDLRAKARARAGFTCTSSRTRWPRGRWRARSSSA